MNAIIPMVKGLILVCEHFISKWYTLLHLGGRSRFISEYECYKLIMNEFISMSERILEKDKQWFISTKS
jgi:hypothetical protein